MKKFGYFAAAALFCMLLNTAVWAAPYINLYLNYDSKTVNYNAERVYLEINGERLDNTKLPMEPIVIDGNTLVPAREVFEKLGASVAWKGDEEEVDILYDNIFVVMHINDNTAFVAGNAKTINVPPKIINNKTMIPLRFCAEVIGLDVEWNNDERLVSISEAVQTVSTETTTESSTQTVLTDEPVILVTESESGAGGVTESTTQEVSGSQKEITDVSFSGASGAAIETIEFKGEGLKVQSSSLTPDTISVTFPETKLLAAEKDLGSGKYFKSCTYKYLEDNSVQAVVVLSDPDVTYSLSAENDGVKLSLFKSSLMGIKYNYGEHEIQISKGNANVNLSNIIEDDDFNNLKYMIELNEDLSDIIGIGTLNIDDDYIKDVTFSLNNGKTSICINEKQIIACKISLDGDLIKIKTGTPKEIYKYVVVLDPGHGGDAPGAIGNGLVEKDLTLSMCQKLIELFEKNPDIKVYPTRTDDSNPAFASRVGLANDIADIFVSVHINSAEASTASGTEVHYYDLHTDSSGLTSLILAQTLQDSLINALGSVDRGVKAKQDIYVTRNTTMPSVLCEIGFISNPMEAAKMAGNSYQQSVAKAIYDGCVSIAEEYSSH